MFRVSDQGSDCEESAKRSPGLSPKFLAYPTSLHSSLSTASGFRQVPENQSFLPTDSLPRMETEKQ